MPTYIAYFYTDANYAYDEIEAGSPEEALEEAIQMDMAGEVMHFESYDEAQPVNQIEIFDADKNELAIWQDDELRLRLAAPKLLAALEWCEMTLADLDASKRKGYLAEAKRLARAAIPRHHMAGRIRPVATPGRCICRSTSHGNAHDGGAL